MEQGVELLKVNAAELRMLCERLGLEWPGGNIPWLAAAQALRSCWSLRHLVVTCGAEGAWWVDDCGNCHHIPVLPGVRLRNAIGAGDAFLAGWVFAASRGCDAAECFCSASACAQARCEVELPWEFEDTRYGYLLEMARVALREYL